MRWIIGDVHGMRECLERLLEEVGRSDSEARFYFVGDYVNRGDDSRGVVEVLLGMQNARFCRGNHDDIFDLILNEVGYAENASQDNRLMAFGWFMEFGLGPTFESYGVDVPLMNQCVRNPTRERLERIISVVPENHRQFFRRLSPTIQDADIFVAHAKWGLGESDDEAVMEIQLRASGQVRHRLLWGRYGEEELLQPKAWKRTGFFGHTPVFAYAASQTTGNMLMEPIVGEKMVLLDTGAALAPQGRLTAWCVEEKRAIQVERNGERVKGNGVWGARD